jgi:hypothetical protein
VTSRGATNSETAWPGADRPAGLVQAEAGTVQGVGEGQVHLVPTRALLSADSPRLAGLDAGHVRQLAELEVELPPVVVHRTTMRVIDGMHRLAAAQLRGEERIGVRFFDGTAGEAFVWAVELNAAHGLPLTQADRVVAARRIIETYPEWSDRRIAAVSGIGRTRVASIRLCSTDRDGQSNTRVGLDGRTRPVSGAGGRESAGEFIAANPAASLREIAEACGIAVSTARDVRERVRSGRDPVPRGQRQRQDPPTASASEASAPVRQRHVASRQRRAASGTVLRDSALQNLRRDPSLRLTEQGRTLLQLLSIHAGSAEDWEGLAGAVPAHRADSVARAARQCAAAWMHLANDIEYRMRTSSATRSA